MNGSKAAPSFGPMDASVTSDSIFFPGSNLIPPVPVATIPEGGVAGSETLVFPGMLMPTNIAIQLYEDPNLTILSDQLYTIPGQFGGTTLIFRSDPDLITLDPNNFIIDNLVETGAPQDVSQDFGFPAGNLLIQSDVESIPEPAALLLLGIGVVALAGYNWRKRKVAAA
jgi:hypothetical protein